MTLRAPAVHPELFDVAALPTRARAKLYKNLQTRVWTRTKAQFIARYLKYFVMITYHGTYIDAFAGPQDKNKLDAWAANLVLRNKPERLRHFKLFEQSASGVARLESLAAELAGKRDVTITRGDSNLTLPAFLRANQIRDKEATFCLLDQRTFECDWATVETIAKHKKGGNKIELFYFLCAGWLERAVSGLTKNKEAVLRKWWGRHDWEKFVEAAPSERPQMFARRFTGELNYKHAMPYPIFKNASDSRIMFYMVHATDHDEAPTLMTRAYNNAMKPLEPTVPEELPGLDHERPTALVAGDVPSVTRKLARGNRRIAAAP